MTQAIDGPAMIVSGLARMFVIELAACSADHRDLGRMMGVAIDRLSKTHPVR